MISYDIKLIPAIYKKIFTPFRKNTMKTRIIKNIFNQNERRCRDIKTQKACEQGWEAVSTYVRLYGSGLFNFGSYVSFPTLFTCFLGFDIPTSSFILIENVFYYSCIYINIYTVYA